MFRHLIPTIAVLVFVATKDSACHEAKLLAELLQAPEPPPRAPAAAPGSGKGARTGGSDGERGGVASPLLGSAPESRAEVARQLLEEAQHMQDSKQAEIATTMAGLVLRGVAYDNSQVPRAVKERVIVAYHSGAVAVMCAPP